MAAKHVTLTMLVLTGFISLSFITNLLGPVFPELIEDFSIGLTLAGFFPFAFFIAYGVMSMPAGVLIERFGERNMMICAYALSAVSSVSFVLVPTFAVAMLALFALGLSMSLLQVAINPLLRSAAGSKHYSFMAVLAQLLFGLAATVTPLIYQKLTTLSDDNWLAPLLQWLPAGMPWLSLYLLFALLCSLMLVWLWLQPFPPRADTSQQRLATGEARALLASQWQLLKNSTVQRYFFAVFCYVALEQGLANSMSVFLQQVHQLDATTVGASAVSQFWLNMTIGCAVGLLLLKLFDCRLILMVFSLASIGLLLAALFAEQAVALWCLPLLGAGLSVMWSVIFALALNSVPSQQGAVAGVLCTGIIGGAVVSPLLGVLTGLFGNIQLAMLCLLLPLAYILSICYWARPLVNNDNWWANRRQQTNTKLEQAV